MIDAEDQDLVRRALQADADSFGQLCKRYYPLLVAVADSILMDHHLAEDAAQEALAYACRQLPGLKKPELFGPWVAAICRNVAKDMLQDRQRQPSPAGDREMQQADCGRGDGQMELVSEGLYGAEAHRFPPRPARPGQSCQRRVGYTGHGNA